MMKPNGSGELSCCCILLLVAMITNMYPLARVRRRFARRTTSRTAESGQVAVVILLVTIVLMTLGVSVITRTTQELRVTQQDAESSRVFNAAEAGVEDALSQDFSSITQPTTITPDVGVADTDVSYTISPVNQLVADVKEGEVATVNIDGFTGNNVLIYWGKESTACNNASIIISAYYAPSADDTRLAVRHETIAPSSCARGDGFTSASNGSQGYHSLYTINLGNGAGGWGLRANPSERRFIRIRPVYADTSVMVSGQNLAPLPVQQHVIRSTGSNTAGGEKRVIEVQRKNTSLPGILDFALYSGGDILKP